MTDLPDLEVTEDDAWEYKRVRLMQLFKWDREQVEKLTAKDVRDIFAALGAQLAHNEKVQWWP